MKLNPKNAKPIFVGKNALRTLAVAVCLSSSAAFADGAPMSSNEVTQAARALANAHGGSAPGAQLPSNPNASNVLFSSAPRVARVDEALENARRAFEAGQSAKPIVSGDGRILYPYQSDVYPQIVCSPLRACSIEVQAGEHVIATVVGDTARWHVQVIEAANPQQVIIKPTEPNIDTNLSIVTDRRTYYADIASRNTNYVPRIGWYFPSEMVNQYRAAQQQQKDEARLTIAEISPTDLDFDYKVSGFGSFKPDQVFSDGTQTFIRLPSTNHDMPGVVAVRDGNTALINARVRDGYLIVDGVHQEYALIAGREMVNITRGNRPVTLKTLTSAGTERDRRNAFRDFFSNASTNSENNRARSNCQEQFDWWNCSNK